MRKTSKYLIVRVYVHTARTVSRWVDTFSKDLAGDVMNEIFCLKRQAHGINLNLDEIHSVSSVERYHTVQLLAWLLSQSELVRMRSRIIVNIDVEILF